MLLDYNYYNLYFYYHNLDIEKMTLSNCNNLHCEFSETFIYKLKNKPLEISKTKTARVSQSEISRN